MERPKSKTQRQSRLTKTRLPLIPIIALLIALLAGASTYLGYRSFVIPREQRSPKTFEECVKQNGNQIQATYPAICVTKDGRRFTQPLSDDEKKQLRLKDETADWKSITVTPNASTGDQPYKLKIPPGWIQQTQTSAVNHTVTFRDNETSPAYTLSIQEHNNMNEQTGKPFADYRELTGLPYDVATVTVEGNQVPRPLPRAGSEHIFEALFFSNDKTLYYSITLETPRDGSKISEGETIFNQILSTFTSLSGQTSDFSTAISLVPAGWITYTYRQYGITLSTPEGWKSDSQDFPGNNESLIRFWQGGNPDAATIQLDIKDSWANTGDAPNLPKNYTVAGTIAAVRVDPPSRETAILDRYQTNIYFEHGTHTYVFQCVHNWLPDQMQICDTMLQTMHFTK